MITPDDCRKLKESVKQLIDKWDPERENSCIFSSTKNTAQSKSRYFLDSGDKISFFMEEDAVDPDTSNKSKNIYIYILFFIFS